MELRRRSSAAAKASDALPLPLHVTNAFFFTLFFSLAYYLLQRWRDKIRSSSPLHLLSLSDIAAIFALLASVIYLLGFFGIHFVQSFVARPADEEPSQCASIDRADEDIANSIIEGDAQPSPLCRVDNDMKGKKVIQRPFECTKPILTELISSIDRVDSDNIIADPVINGKEAVQPSFQCTKPILTKLISSDDDIIIVDSVINGTVPSYSLESCLGDSRRAAAIRREVVQRETGRSLAGLPLEDFDYDAILGQCCEMPVGYVQLPVGVAGPLLLDGAEYTVPMATTEGCLVASTNRGCKAIYASGGASSVVFRDGMSRAPVVRFATVTRAAELMFYLEDPLNFDTLAVVFNRSFS